MSLQADGEVDGVGLPAHRFGPDERAVEAWVLLPIDIGLSWAACNGKHDVFEQAYAKSA